jgi:cytochrome c-type biogenesis protein CcmE
MKRAQIIGIIIIAIAIGAIISTVADSSTYAAFSQASNHPGREYHVVGKLNKEKDFIYDPHENANLFSFYLIDTEGNEKRVIYNGTKPNDFERSEQIVIIGKMKQEAFEASEILMKCPSKYANTELQKQELNSGS